MEHDHHRDDPPQKQSDPPRPHGDKLADRTNDDARGDRAPDSSPTPPGAPGPGTGDMDRPEMNPPDEELP